MKRALALAASVLAAPLAAQNGATLTADAVVVTVGMTIAVTNNLAFGSVPKGVATTVPITGAGAAAVQVTGSPNAFVGITFTLPSVLANIQAAPGSTMPITYSATSAGWRRANNSPAGATLFDPAVGTVGRVGPAPNPNLYIWVGGTVTPAAAAKPGIYTGTIIISLVYT